MVIREVSTHPDVRRSSCRWATASAALASIALLGGCARAPGGSAARVARQLLVQFTVNGQINPADHYFFALDTIPNSSQGPVPVVSPPWGNGWGAGPITYYVEVDAAQPGAGRIGVYKFALDANGQPNLLAPVYLGQPISFDSTDNTNTVRFALDLDQILTPSGGMPSQINVNFIATDQIPVDPNYRGNKLVDGLGRSGASFVSLNPLQSTIYRNRDSLDPESAGDVPDPDLDLTDWQIEVRRS